MKKETRENMATNDDFVRELTWFMSDVRGRSLMRRWLKASGVHTTSFTVDGAAAMAFAEGKKAWGYSRINELKRYAPSQYLLMEKEGMDA